MISTIRYREAMDTLADTIRKEFRKSGRSIKSLADDAGVCYASAHRFIQGTDNTTLATADKVCRILGLKLVPRKSHGKHK